jgi:hypothetical protein
MPKSMIRVQATLIASALAAMVRLRMGRRHGRGWVPYPFSHAILGAMLQNDLRWR